jgi:hypothetical protein
MGGFELMEPPLAVNGRPVYRAAGGKGLYFYFASVSHWCVSPDEADMRAGKATGALGSAAAEPDALTPDQVKSGWIVSGGEKPVAAPSVRVRQVRRGTKGVVGGR